MDSALAFDLVDTLQNRQIIFKSITQLHKCVQKGGPKKEGGVLQKNFRITCDVELYQIAIYLKFILEGVQIKVSLQNWNIWTLLKRCDCAIYQQILISMNDLNLL